MGRFVLSPRAQTDLDDIWNYTAGRWGLDQAETYTRQLWDHILFYRLVAEGIDVVRILHERMDYDDHLP